MFAIAGAHDFHTPATAFGVFGIHTEQIACENRRFITARSGTNFQEAVAVIFRIFRQQQNLQFSFNLFNQLFRISQLFLRHRFHFSIITSQHLFNRLQIRFRLLITTETGNHLSQLSILFGQTTEFFLIGHHIGFAQQRLNFFITLHQPFQFSDHCFFHSIPVYICFLNQNRILILILVIKP